VNASKAELRRSMVKWRQGMSAAEWREKSDRILSHLQSTPLFTQAKTVLAYFSIRQEPDLSPLFQNSQHRWGFPRIQGKTLSWHSWQPGETRQTGAYGIFEPCRDAAVLEPTEVDLILVPAVACDQRGYRLGYGGGFYDRMFSSDEWGSKCAIAIVFDFAYLRVLPIDPWDKTLQGVCTETGFKKVIEGSRGAEN